MKQLIKLIALGAAAAILVVACGEGRPLENLGDVSRSYVYAGTTTSTTLIIDDEGEVLPIGIVTSQDRLWYSDADGVGTGRDPNAVIADVWERSNRADRFIAASRSEINAALPGILFPELIPGTSSWITSQLVYDVASGTLDVGQSAAFGIWSKEPYTVTREEGQIAVLRVGRNIPLCPDDQSTCIALEEAKVIRSDVVDQGLTLSWVEPPYSYSLFCRTPLPDELCWSMAEEMAPMDLLLPRG